MLLLLLSCGPKNLPDVDVAPTTGWQMEEGWFGSCFVPPEYAAIEDAELRTKMQKDTIGAMALQWAGARRDGVNFDVELAEETRDYLLVYPERAQDIAAQNLEHCLGVMRDGLTTSTWGGWLVELHEDLADEACPEPLEDVFHALDIRTGWQLDVDLCAGQEYVVRAPASEVFFLQKDGPEVTIAGLAEPLPPEGAYCREVAGCTWGQLVGRFETEDGQVEVFPIGAEKVLTAPAAGRLSVAVNDDDHSDNAFQIVDGVQDGVTVEVRPR
ncbi:MAG: hypothetical protein GY913_03120 [Proteobacteria bacterium]|nr:hypothetical protein [Pseudomonadota bacterium]MCP4915891.1 hypothetical protein [Pseudomonadota bacterium]